MVKDTILFLHKALQSGQTVLVEGANAAMLDIDFGKFFCKNEKINKKKFNNF